MGADRTRVGLDANILIAGTRLPRWPYEVMRATLTGPFVAALPVQVVDEARRHLAAPPDLAALDRYLEAAEYEALPMPGPDVVRANRDLVRDEDDVPIALALLEGDVAVFVTNDRDFTDDGATADRFRARVRVMLPAVFLRDVVGWTSAGLEAIRYRTWHDLTGDDRAPAPTD
jgi:predicted nucleic acid-binding protein